MYRKWRDGPMYNKPTRIDGKVVLITGCNTGIGKETALELAKRGGHIYMACRNYEKCEEARKEIIELSGNRNVFNRTLDLSSLQSVRDFVEKFNEEVQRLDILINNAGIMSTPLGYTIDGYEQQLAVNHLGPFLLTNLLLDKLKASAPSRIVVVSSLTHRVGKIKQHDLNSKKSYGKFEAYAQSKLANVLFTRHLAKRLRGTGVTINCLHPGSIHTEIGRNDPLMDKMISTVGKFVLRSVKGGAQTTIFAAIDPAIESDSGEYYHNMKRGKLAKLAKDEKLAEWLWKESELMVGLK
ncbi:retinol dehydrogenase 13-like [Musca domestica]|uniref:Retinol dehydrogenase 13-like n=1 Tax=Musca domestica TaxID=7370 RepID=A0ABM3ULP9_MUSDO|nr:retinol dehydrogenase 13-like [Musca domestica]